MEFAARVLVQIPDPRRHLVRYYGAYSNATRGKRKKAAASAEPSSPNQGARECRNTGRTVPRRPPAPVGRTHPPRLRSRPPHLSSLRKRDACDRLHYTTRTHRPHPQPPPQTRQDPSPASALVPAAGHPRLSCAPRPPSGQEERQTCRPGNRSPAFTRPWPLTSPRDRASWPSRWPRSPRHRPSPAAPTSAAGRGAQAPQRKFLSLRR